MKYLTSGHLPILVAAAWVVISTSPAAAAGSGVSADLLRWSHPAILRPEVAMQEEERVELKRKEPPPEETKEEGAGAAIEKELEKGKHTMEKIKRMHKDVPDMIKKDAAEARHTFLPGLNFDWVSTSITVASTLIAMVWYTVFFYKIYETDRSQTFGRWGAQVEGLAEESGTSGGIKPDIVIVLTHPGDAAMRVDAPVGSMALKHTLVVNESSGGVLKETEKVLQVSKDVEAREASLSVMERAGHARDAMTKIIKRTGTMATEDTEIGRAHV